MISKKTDFPFPLFWSSYPLKKGKANAERTWKSLSEENRRLAIECIQPYANSVNPSYLKHGSTYLSQKVWLDDLAPAQAQTQMSEADKTREFIDELNRRHASGQTELIG